MGILSGRRTRAVASRKSIFTQPSKTTDSQNRALGGINGRTGWFSSFFLSQPLILAATTSILVGPVDDLLQPVNRADEQASNKRTITLPRHMQCTSPDLMIVHPTWSLTLRKCKWFWCISRRFRYLNAWQVGRMVRPSLVLFVCERSRGLYSTVGVSFSTPIFIYA